MYSMHPGPMSHMSGNNMDMIGHPGHGMGMPGTPNMNPHHQGIPSTPQTPQQSSMQQPHLHSHAQPSSQNQQVVVPVAVGGQQVGTSSGPPQISLSLLIEFIVQRTYHDITVLAELLPRKTDMERKIEIFNFASRTRMLLIRLLALVKWASSATKVDKCVSIMNFCERSANIFMETADTMAKMARETLVKATLPNFHLPAAIEILTKGTFNRVPRCIKDRIVPSEPITVAQKREILLRLNQVIEHRLVTSDLPLQMRNLTIENGQVTFSVRNEFEASLTLMGDGPHVPWRLLKVNILVEDKETGEGKALMHSMQVKYVEQLIQTRLIDNPHPLHELYNVLHALCLSLQIEVLHSQTRKLCSERLGDYIRIEEAIAGKCLTISYWRELMTKDPNSELGYRFSIQVDPHDTAKPLMVRHVPPLPSNDAKPADQAICNNIISLERLLVHSIYARTKSRLSDLKQEVQRRLSLGDVEATLHGSPAVLSIPILHPCLRSEQLLVTVDTHTGIFLAHVPQYEDNPIAVEIQSTLNEDKSKLEDLVSHLRYWITKQRVHKTLQQLPATSYERLPILFDLNKHPLKDLSSNRMYIRLHRVPNAILIIEFHEKQSNHCEIEYQYHFLWVRPASIEDNPNDETMVAEIPKLYLKALSMVEFDPFLVTHSSTTKVDVQELSDKIIGKRKQGGRVEAPTKRNKFSPYFISDLAHVVSFADERLPFTELVSELSKKNLAHSGVETEHEAIGLIVKIFKFPTVYNITEDTAKKLRKYILSVNCRMQSKGGRSLKVEFLFNGSPVSKINHKTNSKTALLFNYDLNAADSIPKAVNALLEEWAQMVKIFGLMEDLETYINSDIANVSQFMSIKSFSFNEAVLQYGPNHSQLVKVKWSAVSQKFILIFGGENESAAMCPHTILKEQLENHLNIHKSIPLLAKILHETYSPIKSICHLSTVPQMSVNHLSSSPQTQMNINQQRGNHPVETFIALPQSPTHVKIMFYNTYCLDVQIKADGLVYIRDGAISLFDQSKVLDETQPIQGLKSFLMLFVDDNSLQRRQSQTEDDNPPSPMVMDDSQSLGPKFQTPHTPPSNPLTPASPHPNPSTMGSFLQSPPTIKPQPSPGGHQPSPAPVGSPFPSAQSPMALGSPATRPSPRQTGLSPGNPQGVQGIQRPSAYQRILPHRLWAGAHPTTLSPQAFDEICRPSPISSPGPGLITPNIFLSPLHRFMGCLYLRRHLQHMVRQENWIKRLPTNEHSSIAIKIEGMTCRISCFASNNFQSLHAKLEPDHQMMNHWSPELLQVLEKFFDTRVAAPPFRPNALTAFLRILQCPIEAFIDIVNIIRYEMSPELMSKQNLKWSCRMCLTVPPAASPIIPLGHAGILRVKEKMVLFLHLTRVNVQVPPGQEPLSIVIPLVYDIKEKTTSVAQKEINPITNLASQHLLRLQRSGQFSMQRCTIFSSVQDLLYNFSLPNDGPPHHIHSGMMGGFHQQQGSNPQMMGGPQMMPGQMGPMVRPPMSGPQQRMMNPNMVMPQRGQMMPQQAPNQYMSS